jgi:hypothetical protein
VHGQGADVYHDALEIGEGMQQFLLPTTSSGYKGLQGVSPQLYCMKFSCDLWLW